MVNRRPAGPGWLHEVKHDGFRILVRKLGERAEDLEPPRLELQLGPSVCRTEALATFRSIWTRATTRWCSSSARSSAPASAPVSRGTPTDAGGFGITAEGSNRRPPDRGLGQREVAHLALPGDVDLSQDERTNIPRGSDGRQRRGKERAVCPEDEKEELLKAGCGICPTWPNIVILGRASDRLYRLIHDAQRTAKG